MRAVDKIIFECVDSALSEFDFVDKTTFYQTLEQMYGITPMAIAENFELFHKILSSSFGANHFRIEREINRLLNERAKKGVYAKTDKIEAFSLMVNTYLEESFVANKRIKETISLTEYNLRLRKQIKDVQAQLKGAERLAAIGATAGMVGHDIRNPLQALTGDLYLLEEEVKELSDGERKLSMQESIDSMKQNISYINKIVQDLQDYAKPLKPEQTTVRLPELIDKIFQSIIPPKNIELEVQVTDNLEIKTDPEFIRRILTNLATNAIQAMPEGGKLTVKAAQAEDKLCIIVSDTGVGIPMHVREKLFTPLVTSKSKGQGLGLAVVKRLVEALEGKISYETETDRGTKFIIKLPSSV